jgi:hypothetical protein
MVWSLGDPLRHLFDDGQLKGGSVTRMALSATSRLRDCNSFNGSCSARIPGAQSSNSRERVLKLPFPAHGPISHACGSEPDAARVMQALISLVAPRGRSFQ